jgi:hypothetical protein
MASVIPTSSVSSVSSVPSNRASRRPVSSFASAQQIKKKIEAEAAAESAAKSMAALAAAALKAQLYKTTERATVPISECPPSRRSSDTDYPIESPDEMDYEASVEYAEHLRFNRSQREKQRVHDYSKDLSETDDGEDEERSV